MMQRKIHEKTRRKALSRGSLFLFCFICFIWSCFCAPAWSAEAQGSWPQTQNRSQPQPQLRKPQNQGVQGQGVQTWPQVPQVQGAQTQQTQTPYPTPPAFEPPPAPPLSEQEIEYYLEQMLLDEPETANSMGELMRRLPRYGMSFFRQPSSYAPLESVPVTSGYLLGPDDELVITLWGMVEEAFNVTINRDGMAVVPHIGAVRLAGYTLEEAKRVLKAQFDRYFTDYSMNLSTGGLRSLTVYVTGDVKQPGAYTISSFSTLVNALIASGGPSDSGSLRRVELKRGGKTIRVFDMYDLLLKGDKSNDVRLLPEDVVFVPPSGPLVALIGEIQRPGVYELKGDTTVEDILNLAGGLSFQAFKGRVQYYKGEGQRYRVVFEGDVSGLGRTLLSNGDVLRLFPVVDVPTVVHLSGPVGRPGVYGVKPGHTRISDIISQAGGLMPTASDRLELTRVTPTLQGPLTQRFEVNLKAALEGDDSQNLRLERGDYLLVHIIPDWEAQRVVKVKGEVMRPGSYAIVKGERLSDLLRRVEGFTSRASLKGAIFTRKAVAEEQRVALNRMADQMEKDLLDASTDFASSGENVNKDAFEAERKQRLALISRLREVDIMGRVIVKLDVPDLLKGTPWDFELEDGDALFVPEVSSVINVMGAVYTTSSHAYVPRMGVNDYINVAGGYLRSAHKRMVYLLKSDGTVIRLTRNTGMLSDKRWRAPKGLSATLEPGDTIVAPVKYSDRQSFTSFRDTIDIIYKVALAVGVILK